MTNRTGKVRPEELIDGCKAQQDVARLYQQMLQRVTDRSLSAELDAHPGCERHAKSVEDMRANTRNGTTKKRLKGTFGGSR